MEKGEHRNEFNRYWNRSWHCEYTGVRERKRRCFKRASVVAFDRDTNKIKAIGEEARLMLGRTPGNVVAIRPLRKGVISDYTVTEQMLKYLSRKRSAECLFANRGSVSVCRAALQRSRKRRWKMQPIRQVQEKFLL